MPAACNDDSCNHLCSPVLSVESAVSVVSDSPLRKTKKMLLLMEEIFGTMDVLAALRIV